jgi:hypothetical protein
MLCHVILLGELLTQMLLLSFLLRLPLALQSLVDRSLFFRSSSPEHFLWGGIIPMPIPQLGGLKIIWSVAACHKTTFKMVAKFVLLKVGNMKDLLLLYYVDVLVQL